MAIGLIGLLTGVALLGVASTHRTTSIVVSQPHPTAVAGADLEPAATEGVVYFRHDVPGWSVFGVGVVDHDYYLQLGVTPPEGCTVDWDRKRLSGRCEALPLNGEVFSEFRSPERAEFVLVQIEVSPTCYAAIADRARWPSDLPACDGF